jgi:hypothetical protein
MTSFDLAACSAVYYQVPHCRSLNPIVFSLSFQDLEYLSEGLEGRSNNPVALLFDILTKPNADLGSEVPSTLSWAKREKGICDHVVLGKGQPGGVWQVRGK